MSAVVVSVLAFYYHDPSLNPAELDTFFLFNVKRKERKRRLDWPF